MRVKLLTDGGYSVKDDAIGQIFDAEPYYRSFLVTVPTTYGVEMKLCFLPHMVEVVNEYQEALEWFLKWEVVVERLKDYNFFNEKAVTTPYDKLSELAAKQTPLTPINRELENLDVNGWITVTVGHCPTCGYEDLMQTHDYCSTCGQKLDWGDMCV